MKISNFSVDRPVAISMLIIAVVLLGMVALPKLRVDLYPDMNLPYVLVSTNYQGASPSEVETLVTRPLESALATVSDLQEIVSWSEPGVSMIGIRLEWGSNMDQAALDIREKVDMVKGSLPSEVRTPQVFKMDPNSMPILSYTLSGSDLSEMKRLAEDVIQPRMERISGVASVNITGGREREVKVVLEPAKLQSYGLTAGQIAQTIGSDNITGTAGSVIRGTNDLDLRVLGEYRSVQDIENIAVAIPGGGSVSLKDIAQIKNDFKKTTQVSYVNGRPSVGLSVMKETGGNTVQVANSVNALVAELQNELPGDMKFDTVMDTSKFINDSIRSVVEHALAGGILSIIILYLFLRSFRSTLVVALVIPISVIATFSMMYFGGQTINLLSLGGLALGIGSLVDFSVVVLESIYRHRSSSTNILEAAKIGTSEVANAVTASAATQVVVFMPIVFVSGLAGILFGPMALTVSFSHLAALFAALTLVPMITTRMLKVRVFDAEEDTKSGNRTLDMLHAPAEKFDKKYRQLEKKYSVLLNWALNHRKTVIAGTVGLFIAACIILVTAVGTEFIPQMDQGQISVDIELPAGSQLSETGNMVSKVEDLANGNVSTDLIFSQVGSGGMFAGLGAGNSNVATMQIKLKPLDDRTESTNEVMEGLREELKHVPGAKFTVKAGGGEMGGAGAPISVRINGDDLDTLKQLGDRIADEIKTVPGTRNVFSSLDEANPELQVTVDRQRAGQYGITAGQILSSVRVAFDGQVASRLKSGGDEIDVRLMFPENYRQDINNVYNIVINTPSGAKVSLRDVATVEVKSAPVSIYRYNQTRYVQVDAELLGRDLGSVNRDIQAKIDSMSLPPGYNIELGGQAADMAESFGDLGLAVIMAIALVYMVMAAQFESLFFPFVIMFSIPPTLIGVALGLLLTGHNLSVTAIIGYIMLVGIVVNNAIVLLDYVNTLRKRGISRDEALRKAGPVRLRPILMTTLSTVLALLPLAFGRGEGAEGQAPMAVVVSFGLTFSTLITLILIPVVYSVVDDLSKKVVKRVSLMFGSGNLSKGNINPG